MPHETPLIATIVIGLGLAFILGAIANRRPRPAKSTRGKRARA